MKKLLKEPLVHFILIGIGLFILYGWVSGREDSRDKIYFDDYDMNNIIASWEMQWRRLPTDEELKSLVEQNIRQEVFYQEALKMNLDHNDEIIKRRLAQKMNFLSNDLATLKEPNENELRKYYEENQDKYLLPPIYSFYQVSYRSDSRPDPESDARQSLSSIKGQSPETLKGQGDKLPFPYFFNSIDKDELDRQLGLEFATALKDLDTVRWTGPVRSGFGWHLVVDYKGRRSGVKGRRRSKPVKKNNQTLRNVRSSFFRAISRFSSSSRESRLSSSTRRKAC